MLFILENPGAREDMGEEIISRNRKHEIYTSSLFYTQTAMDYTSGYEWRDLNDIIKKNFRSVLWTIRPNDRRNLERFQNITSAIATLFGINLLFSGSVVEGSLMNPRLRVEGFEADVMFFPSNFILSYYQQRDFLRQVQYAPGYVIVDISRSEDPEGLLRDVDGLKTSKLRKNHVIPRPSVRRDIHSIFDHLPNNWATMTLKDFLQFRDSLRIQRIKYEVDYSGGAAIAATLSGISSYFLDTDKRKGIFRELLDDLTDKLLSVPRAMYGEATPENNDRATQDRDRSFLLRDVSYDYVRMPIEGREWSLMTKIDVVPAIECVGWPEIALGFFRRMRHWPDSGVLRDLRHCGFHLVFKPLEKENDSMEWRISFSKAELTLFQNMDAFKFHCYRVFKTLYYCELTLPKVLCSYYMKTIFLWACERLPLEAWVKENLSQIIMTLLDDLFHCLLKKQCQHFFIPECNLFAHIPEEFLLDQARAVSRIRTHPDRYPKYLKS